MAPNLGWVDVGLRDELVRMFGDDVPIHVANEADLGALAEARRGAAVGADHILYLSGEVGVGGGIIVDGEPFIGAAGYGGEVGHMPVNPAGLACRCGSIGCWETEAGCAQSLLQQAGRVATGGRDAIDELLAEAEAGSPIALGALEETGRWIGIGLAGLVNLLDPRLVVFGGLFGGSIHSSLGSSRRSSIVVLSRRLDDWCGSSHRSSAWRRRCAAPRSSRWNHSWPTRPDGCARGT